MLTSGDIAGVLGVTEPTIRAYANIGKEFMSEGATAGNRQRVYTIEDTKVITLIWGLRKRRMSEDECVASLKAGNRGDPIDLTRLDVRNHLESEALAIHLQEKIDELKKEVFDLSIENAKYEVTIEHLQNQVETEITELKKMLGDAQEQAMNAYDRGFDKGFDKGKDVTK